LVVAYIDCAFSPEFFAQQRMKMRAKPEVRKLSFKYYNGLLFICRDLQSLCIMCETHDDFSFDDFHFDVKKFLCMIFDPNFW
jgi:hypothetical protein